MTENTQQYALMVSTLSKPGGDIQQALTPSDCAVWHAATGVAGEAGELLDAIKKAVIYRRPLDRTNVIEELGDLEYYMEDLRQRLGITRTETLAANVAKLAVRYQNGYSDKAAQERADKQETTHG